MIDVAKRASGVQFFFFYHHLSSVFIGFYIDLIWSIYCTRTHWYMYGPWSDSTYVIFMIVSFFAMLRYVLCSHSFSLGIPRVPCMCNGNDDDGQQQQSCLWAEWKINLLIRRRENIYLRDGDICVIEKVPKTHHEQIISDRIYHVIACGHIPVGKLLHTHIYSNHSECHSKKKIIWCYSFVKLKNVNTEPNLRIQIQLTPVHIPTTKLKRSTRFDAIQCVLSLYLVSCLLSWSS